MAPGSVCPSPYPRPEQRVRGPRHSPDGQILGGSHSQAVSPLDGLRPCPALLLLHPITASIFSSSCLVTALFLLGESRRGSFPLHKYTLYRLGVLLIEASDCLFFFHRLKGGLFGGTLDTLDAKNVSRRTGEKRKLDEESGGGRTKMAYGC